VQSEIEGRDVPARVNRPLVVTLIAIYEFVGAGAGHAVGDREKFAALPVQRLNRGFRVVAHSFPSAGIGKHVIAAFRDPFDPAVEYGVSLDFVVGVEDRFDVFPAAID